MHATVLQYVPTQADSISEQLSQIDDVVTKKPDAIVIAPVDYKAIVPGIRENQRRQDPGCKRHRPELRRRLRLLRWRK